MSIRVIALPGKNVPCVSIIVGIVIYIIHIEKSYLVEIDLEMSLVIDKGINMHFVLYLYNIYITGCCGFTVGIESYEKCNLCTLYSYGCFVSRWNYATGKRI